MRTLIRKPSERSSAREIPYLFGIRGVTSLSIVIFHLNYIVLAATAGVAEPLYHRLTDWMRYGDFRVSAFFVISGYLLTLPNARRADWSFPRGVRAFLARRCERLLIPYEVALAISLVLFLAWDVLAGHPAKLSSLIPGVVTHVLMVHNLHPKTYLYINDTLWNVALEFQCYLLFALVLVPLMRATRAFGPLAQLGLAALLALVPHFALHGFLDWTRPWFILLYAMGVATAALGNPSYPAFARFERAVPWGSIAIAATLVTVVLVARSPIDTPYGDGWLQNLTLGLAMCALLVFTQRGMRGAPRALIAPVVRALESRTLGAAGRFSYSTYLIHYPVLRLLVELVARFTHSALVIGAISLIVFAPLTVALSYLFHVLVERPYQRGRRERPAPQVIRGTEEAQPAVESAVA